MTFMNNNIAAIYNENFEHHTNAHPQSRSITDQFLLFPLRISGPSTASNSAKLYTESTEVPDETVGE